MSYWEDRQEETLNAILDKAEVSSKEISNLYAKSSYYINEKVQGIFDRYRAKYDIGIQEATELLNQLDDPTSYDEMLGALKKSKSKERQELLKKLEAPAFRHRINRLQELQKVIDDVMLNVYNQEKNISTAHYIDSAQESYYRTTYNIQHDVGYEYNFANLDSKKVDKLLKNRWSGANYSQRIWNNTQTLAGELKENLLLGMMTGMSEREMIQSLTERFQVSNFKARRLIETESAYISSMMDMEAYKEADIDTMKFMAIHDMKTSKICQKHDGKYVKISEAKVGVNVPPLHPHCRSRMRPVIDEEFDRNLKRRVRKEDGTYEIVDANETYEQWYERVIKKVPLDPKNIAEAKQRKEMWIEKNTPVEKQIKIKRNYGHDLEQYERYIQILGNEFVPDSFEKFQEMKYNDTDKWNETKSAYRIVNQYENHTSNGMNPSKIYDLDREAFYVKRNDFSSDFKTSGNIGIMELDGKRFYSHSKANLITDKAYKNFKGDKSKLILKPQNKLFTTKFIGTHERDVDSEYKLLEFAASIIKDNDYHEVLLLSEMQSCESCKNVLKQFTERYPNVKVSMVSTKESRMKKKYNEEEKGKEAFRNRWKKK